MAKKRTRKAKAKTITHVVTPEEQMALTAREKKAILEKAVFCSQCKEEGHKVLAAKVNDAGVPLCRRHM